MADETEPRKKSPILIIVIVIVAVLVILPVCAICGLTMLGSSLQSTFEEVAREVEAEQAAQPEQAP